jgi:hypothetical protein
MRYTSAISFCCNQSIKRECAAISKVLRKMPREQADKNNKTMNPTSPFSTLNLFNKNEYINLLS